jgi:hypothetical protein
MEFIPGSIRLQCSRDQINQQTGQFSVQPIEPFNLIFETLHIN